MLHIDGSYGEGGGQIIRTALALSSITGKPFKADNIRHGRKQPGLKMQHLHCIKALVKLCKAKCEGAELASEKIMFVPGEINGGKVKIDIGTAGSITLLLQSIILPTLFAKKKTRFEIYGGTDVNWSMPIDYFTHVYLPHFCRYAQVKLKLLKRGFYPKGAGQVELLIKPEDYDETTKPVQLDKQGRLVHVKGISYCTKDLEPKKVAQRMAMAGKRKIGKAGYTAGIRTEYCDSESTGCGIVLWAMFSKLDDEIDVNDPIVLGADELGEKGKRAEILGEQAVDKLLKEIKTGSTVDRHMADNLIPLLGLFGGTIKTSELTSHTLTNIWVCEQFLGVKYDVDKTANIVSCSEGYVKRVLINKEKRVEEEETIQ